jgi:hypothetical protein
MADLGVPGVRLTSVGLEILDPNLSLDELEHVGWVLGKVRDATSFAMGDLLNFGEAEHGEDFAQAVEATGRSKVTLMEYARVARLVVRARRRSGLTFTHHQLIAAREPEEQEEWLDRATANRWSVEEFRGALAGRIGFDESLSTRQEGRPTPEVLAPPADADGAARALLAAAQFDGHGLVHVPEHAVVRLANALGVDWPESQPLKTPGGRRS